MNKTCEPYKVCDPLDKVEPNEVYTTQDGENTFLISQNPLAKSHYVLIKVNGFMGRLIYVFSPAPTMMQVHKCIQQAGYTPSFIVKVRDDSIKKNSLSLIEELCGIVTNPKGDSN